MKGTIYSLLFGLVYLCLFGCAAQNKHTVNIQTVPPDAIVSAHHSGEISNSTRRISGVTPFQADLDFGESGKLWLEIEKRGYAPKIAEVFPQTATITFNLERIRNNSGELLPPYALPEIKRILLVTPDLQIIERGFSSEKVSEEKSKIAQQELIKGIEKFFAGQFEVLSLESSASNHNLLRPLWRDVHSAMELLDPVRLKYYAYPPMLETKSSRAAALEMGKRYNAEVMIFIKGKKNVETAGLQAGIAGTAIAGTATSYGAGYGRALANNDSFFLYNIYTPSFGKGTLIGKAALIDCRSGEVLWVNRGLLDNVLTDLSLTIRGN